MKFLLRVLCASVVKGFIQRLLNPEYEVDMPRKGAKSAKPNFWQGSATDGKSPGPNPFFLGSFVGFAPFRG